MSSDPAVRFLDRATPPHIVTLVFIAGISALSMSVFLPSLATMAEDFNTSYAVMQLSVSAYLGVTAIFQIGAGPISDRFGRRPVVLSSLALFVLFTIGCLLAPTAETFLIFRMGQAVSAACMVLSRAIVRDTVPQDQAASMIGYVTMGMALIPMVGPMIGGALDDLFGWRSTFVFLALAGAAILVLCWKDQGETVREGGVSFAEQVRTYPELLSSRRFWGYVLCAGFASGAFFAFLGGASFVAGEVFGLSATVAGFAFGAPAIGYAFGNFLSGRFTMRHGINRMILWGTLITSSGLFLSLFLSLTGTTTALTFFGLCTTVGLGNGLVMPNATAGLLSVRPHLAGTASGVGGAIFIGFGALLAALAGAVLVPGSSELPLTAIMATSSTLGIFAIVYVIRREAQLIDAAAPARHI